MKILIAIHGAHSQPEQMRAQRETWLRSMEVMSLACRDLLGVDYRFFLGDPAIDAEDVVHVPGPDGPIWEGHRRTWHGNRKTEAICRYASAREYDYVFKCDDDTFVDVAALLDSGFEAHEYSGFTESHWTQRTGNYRWSQGGAGYWLSREAMEIVAGNGLRLCRAEDFAVGELLAQHEIQPQHDERYNPWSQPKTEDWITLHKIGPEMMRELHA